MSSLQGQRFKQEARVFLIPAHLVVDDAREHLCTLRAFRIACAVDAERPPRVTTATAQHFFSILHLPKILLAWQGRF